MGWDFGLFADDFAFLSQGPQWVDVFPDAVIGTGQFQGSVFPFFGTGEQEWPKDEFPTFEGLSIFVLELETIGVEESYFDGSPFGGLEVDCYE